jgi:hypothetical protein
MFTIREVIHCRPGKVRPLVDKFKAVGAVMERLGYRPFRLYTDVSGERFWTVVAETEAETIDAFLEMEGKVMSDPAAQEAMGGYHDLVQRGRREVFRNVD